jgi:hypothetical protein
MVVERGPSTEARLRKLMRRGPAGIRRWETIEALELRIGVVTWRKDSEWHFLYILANHLTTS